MSCPYGTFCLLALLAFQSSSLLAAETPEWRTAEPGWSYEFPRDHGPHPEFKTEWWYSTGNVRDDLGKEYGFQLTFFREGIQPGGKSQNASRFRVTDLPFAHFAFTDVSGESFKFSQQSSRGAFGEAGFATPPGRVAWMNDWVLEQDAQDRFHLKANAEGRSIDLILTQTRDPLIHGRSGISPKSVKPGHASHYYSLTRLQAEGTVCINGIAHPVHGLVWFDHEWATNSLDPGEAGWDWSGLHLSSGDDLMIFRIRDAKGATLFTSGTLREASGEIHEVKDLKLTPGTTWKSPHTGGLYPAVWFVKIPSLQLSLTIKPKLADQELVLSPFAYWEGAVRGQGSQKNQAITAEGYFEMTGYGGKVLGMSQP